MIVAFWGGVFSSWLRFLVGIESYCSKALNHSLNVFTMTIVIRRLWVTWACLLLHCVAHFLRHIWDRILLCQMHAKNGPMEHDLCWKATIFGDKLEKAEVAESVLLHRSKKTNKNATVFFLMWLPISERRLCRSAAFFLYSTGRSPVTWHWPFFSPSSQTDRPVYRDSLSVCFNCQTYVKLVLHPSKTDTATRRIDRYDSLWYHMNPSSSFPNRFCSILGKRRKMLKEKEREREIRVEVKPPPHPTFVLLFLGLWL